MQSAQLLCKHQLNRAMVRAKNITVDGCILNLRRQPVRDQPIVDAPSRVIFPGIKAVAPPAVCPQRVRMAKAKGIRKATIQKRRKLLPFLIGKACISPIWPGILQIDLLMGDIEIPTDHHRFLCIQGHQMVSEGIFPLHPVINAFQSLLGIRRITGHYIVRRKLQCDQPSLCIERRNAYAVGHSKRLCFREDRCAGIPLLFSVIPILVIFRQIQFHLSGLKLCLLQAEHIGVRHLKEVQEPLPQAGAQPVHIP